MREEDAIEGAIQAKLKLNQGHKGKKKMAQWNNFRKGKSSNKWSKANNPPCHIAKFCKNGEQPQVEAQVADQNEEEDYLFATFTIGNGVVPELLKARELLMLKLSQ
ncbi:hypothetical protein A2U01_0032530, partial [Trifolium medium]|nr:hypothetical protein [Trifolium medium]